MSEKHKHSQGKNRKKAYIITVSLILALLVSVGATLAYITVKTNKLENTFTPVKTETEVIEDVLGSTKKDVKIQNNSDYPCYIRAKIIVSWVELGADKKPTGNISGVKPVENTDYKVDMSSDNWKLGEDGFYYYRSPVTANGLTENLIDEAYCLQSASIPEGYSLSVEIIASSVQSEPAQAVYDAWGLNVDANGDLIIAEQGE